MKCMYLFNYCKPRKTRAFQQFEKDKDETLTKFWVKIRLEEISMYTVQQKIRILFVVILWPYIGMILI